jgi:hypothetical protein
LASREGLALRSRSDYEDLARWNVLLSSAVRDVRPYVSVRRTRTPHQRLWVSGPGAVAYLGRATTQRGQNRATPLVRDAARGSREGFQVIVPLPALRRASPRSAPPGCHGRRDRRRPASHHAGTLPFTHRRGSRAATLSSAGSSTVKRSEGLSSSRRAGRSRRPAARSSRS